MLGSRNPIGSLGAGVLLRIGSPSLSTTLGTLTASAIESELNKVSGIGKVFSVRRHPKNWADFFTLYKGTDGLFKVSWFWLSSVSEDVDSEDGIGDIDASEYIHWTKRIETYTIEMYFGHADNESNLSQPKFDRLAEAIENQFRFQQNLNSAAYKSFPLQRIYSDIGSFDEVIMAHKAEWQLQVVHRIMNPSIN